jgi:cytidine deaminase
VAYILNQFKRPEEIETLRNIYGDAFIQISAYCSKQKRLDTLVSKISADHLHEKHEDEYRGDAYKLILRDESEEDLNYGQRVRDAFPLADVIINADNENSIRSTCERFIRVFFNDNFVTPKQDEYGSYLAKAVSLRSSDLSRQVGAIALTKSGEIISAGCNEVPKAMGGTYWEDDEYDMRDFQIGYDPSAEFKKRLVQDLLRKLKKGGW